MTTHQAYISVQERPFGLLFHENPKQLYETLAEKDLVLVAREGFDASASLATTNILGFNVTSSLTEVTYFALLKTFLEYHKLRVQTKQNSFCPVKIIVLEVESILTSEAELIILLYVYLLRTGSTLPRFYVLFTCPVQSITELVGRMLGRNEPFVAPVSEAVNLREHYISPQNYSSTHHVVLDFTGNEELFSLVKQDFVRSKPARTMTVHQRFNEVLAEVYKADLVCLNSSIRVLTSSLYVGNRRVKKSAGEEFLLGAVALLKRLKPELRVVVLNKPKAVSSDDQNPFAESTSGTGVFRENLYKDFTQDVVVFMKHFLSLQSLYRCYMPGDVSIRGRIGQAEDLLERLGFMRQDEANLLTQDSNARGAQHLALVPLPKWQGNMLVNAMNLHPVIARIMLLWKAEGKPLFPILLFVAVIHTFEKTTREVKEHGVKEVESDVSTNCRFGEAMDKALQVIKRVQRIDTPELGRTGAVLKRLVVKSLGFFEGCPVEAGFFDLNKFTLLLASLLRKHFPQEILTKDVGGPNTGVSIFRNSKHPFITWRTDTNTPFAHIFPLSSLLERNGNCVLLYVPL